jgi:DNA-binding response OmpR family regulator
MIPRALYRAPAAQPTCRQRPASTTTGPNPATLEISHAGRLRAKLSSDTHRLVINVSGVGYRLIDR